MTEATEYDLLESVRGTLAAATGVTFNYPADAAYIVQRPQVKHLAEVAPDKVIYLVSPGDVNPQDYSQCATLFPGDLLVTAGQTVGTPELPWSDGYVPLTKIQLRMFRDIYTALHLKQFGDAILKVANRNLDLEVDGWVLVQAQITFEFTETDA